MDNKFFIFPYTQGSEGAKLLAEELGGKRILREGSNYTKKDGHVVINWGASDCPAKFAALNGSIKGILNKKDFFERLKGTGLTPAFETDKTAALDNLGFPILCRTKLEGKDGEGIVIAEKYSQVVPAKLYVQYEDKTSEYRIHVGRHPVTGYQIIGGQKKVKKTQFEGTKTSPDPRLMVGDDHGLIWTVNNAPVLIPDKVKAAVKAAFEKFPELTFCAFDVIYNNSTGKAFVLEANSAPMGTPETMKRYAKFFNSFPAVSTAPATPAGATAAPAASSAVSAPSVGGASGLGNAGVIPVSLPTVTPQQLTAALQVVTAYVQQQQS